MTQIYYHAVLVDETGCEFGAGCRAATRDEALEILRENYPESLIVQLESPEDTLAREEQIRAGAWADDDEYNYHDDEWDDDYEDW